MDVGFESPEYSIVESDGEVIVCVQLTGFLDIPVSIDFSVRDPPGRDQGKISVSLISARVQGRSTMTHGEDATQRVPFITDMQLYSFLES